MKQFYDIVMNLFKLTMHSRFLKMATDGDKTTLNIMNLHSYTMYTKNCVIIIDTAAVRIAERLFLR